MVEAELTRFQVEVANVFFRLKASQGCGGWWCGPAGLGLDQSPDAGPRSVHPSAGRVGDRGQGIVPRIDCTTRLGRSSRSPVAVPEKVEGEHAAADLTGPLDVRVASSLSCSVGR